MTPWLLLLAVIAILALAVWAGRGIRAAAEREAREDAAWDALGALIREGRARRGVTFDMTPADARHALALDTLRRRALGGRQDRWAA